MTPFYHRPRRCLRSVCTVPSCTAQYIHNHSSLVVVPRGETPGLGIWLRSVHSHPRTSHCLICPRFPFCRGLHWLATIAYWGWPGPSRPSHSPAQDISLSLATYITCTPPPRKGSTVHMPVLACGHLCIRTHLRTHILSDTSSYPILHTHFTDKPRFKFPTSRGRGLIPEVRMAMAEK